MSNFIKNLTRRRFFKLLGISAAGVGLNHAHSNIKNLFAGEKKDNIEQFCYEYDASKETFTAIEVNEAYGDIPPELHITDPSNYIQPWSGYDPPCTLSDKDDCNKFPSQTSNIKVAGVYDGIEVQDNKWIKMACDEGRSSVEKSMGPFGAVVVQIDDSTNKVLRYWRNHNHVTAWNDPTAHAEVTTIRAACKQLGVYDLGKILKSKSKITQVGEISHCEIYSSVEPCSMCYSAISWARISTLVFAATRYDAAVQGVNFSDEDFYVELSLPYKDRKLKVYQSTTPNSLDAFNLWKRSNKVTY